MTYNRPEIEVRNFKNNVFLYSKVNTSQLHKKPVSPFHAVILALKFDSILKKKVTF